MALKTYDVFVKSIKFSLSFTIKIIKCTSSDLAEVDEMVKKLKDEKRYVWLHASTWSASRTSTKKGLPSTVFSTPSGCSRRSRSNSSLNSTVSMTSA